MSFGKEFIKEEDCATNVKTVLPFPGSLVRVVRPRSKGTLNISVHPLSLLSTDVLISVEEKETLKIASEVQAKRNKELEAVDLQREKEEQEKYRQIQASGTSQTPNQSRPVSVVAATPQNTLLLPIPASTAATAGTSIPSSSASAAVSSINIPLSVLAPASTASTAHSKP